MDTVDGVKVAPLAGAWIEIPSYLLLSYSYSVAPLAGAWIEIKRAKAEKYRI